MERTVPSTASDEIDLYLRTLYSLLRSTSDVQIRTLEEVHAGMNSSLHPAARQPYPDTSAFIYSLLRLPECMPQVRLVVLGQGAAVFSAHGYANVEDWQPVSARARRRSCFFNGEDTLACTISSRSDIDDVLPGLTAYQIEWNKLHHLLEKNGRELLRSEKFEHQDGVNSPAWLELSQCLHLSPEDLERLHVIWGANFLSQLQQIANRPCDLRVRLLNGSLSEYWRATRQWWDNIEYACPELMERPVYFVSSNTHSLANLASGFALQHKAELLEYLQNSSNTELLQEWREISARTTPSSAENFLYYVLKKYQGTPQGKSLLDEQTDFELNRGITRISSGRFTDIEAQVIDLARLDATTIDPRLYPDLQPGSGCDFLSRSDALILNIDYPLGLAAYNILAKVAEHVDPILGVYTIGKAATLNAVRGDMMIPQVVQDEHSQNTYLFKNAFSAADVAPYLTFGTVLDNQKAVSVLGTFLQNARIMDVVYREGYTDIEMEAGPYLSALYEMYRPKRHPYNEIVNLYEVPFDIGILHYASDTPLNKGSNLGAGTLSYFGMDSTYAATLAVLRRIFQLECKRVS